MASIPPGTILLVGALLVPFLHGRVRNATLLVLPIVSFLHLLFFLPTGTEWSVRLFDYTLTPIRVDALSLVWGYIFHIAAFAAILYALHVKAAMEHVVSLAYAGASIGAVFAGDLITLFLYWELTAISSVFLIWASRTERSYGAGMRYLIVQVISGVLLLSGILLHLRDSGSIEFTPFHANLPAIDARLLGLNSPGTLLIFVAFGIKCAFPLLHGWLKDAYPEATPTGSVFLSSFTTKLAIYALLRSFPGTGILIEIGATMAIFTIIYSMMENDLRRLLAYSLNNQLGFMVVAIGLADFVHHADVAAMAVNATAAHAVAHILYKSLLFMAVGAVITQTGTALGSELGGLAKAMPWTMRFCVIGGASMSVPLCCGFVSKSMIMDVAAESHHPAIWLMLLFAAAGVFLSTAIKVPYVAFFGNRQFVESPNNPICDAPLNMRVAMGFTAILCIGVGVLPFLLFRILPYPVHKSPYTVAHVITQLQLLLWTSLAFVLAVKFRLYPAEQRMQQLDADWFYRRPFMTPTGSDVSFVIRTVNWLAQIRSSMVSVCMHLLSTLWKSLQRLCGPSGGFSGTWSVSTQVTWAVTLMTGYLLWYYTFH